MKFISKEEFLKQPKEVQDKIRELWNPQQNDVFTRKGCKGIIPYLILDRDEDMIMTDTCNCEVWYEYLDNQIVPLLTMDKIIDMIEDMIGMYLDIMLNPSSYGFMIYLYKEAYDDLPEKVFSNFIKQDRLHALWEVLIEIINEKLLK